MIGTLLLLLGAVVTEPTPAPAEPEAKDVPVLASCDDFNRSNCEVYLFRRVNAERARRGLQPLVWDGPLVRFCRRHSLRQCRSGMFHSGCGMRENVCLGANDAEQAFQMWLHSPAHCANMMAPDARRYGGSGFMGPAGGAYTQVFAR